MFFREKIVLLGSKCKELKENAFLNNGVILLSLIFTVFCGCRQCVCSIGSTVLEMGSCLT